MHVWHMTSHNLINIEYDDRAKCLQKQKETLTKLIQETHKVISILSILTSARNFNHANIKTKLQRFDNTQIGHPLS